MNNPLGAYANLMVKPDAKERERVAVVIKGVKKSKEKDKEEVDKETKAGPIIVDETKKGFDRETLLKKLAENKKSKVTVNTVMKIPEKKLIVEPIEPQKKAKKIALDERIILNGDEESDEEEFIFKKPKESKKVADEPMEEEEEFVLAKPKKKIQFDDAEIEAIKIIAPKKKTRITRKAEKGIAVLGPETLVEIGDTDLRERLPIRSPPVLIKVSNYYMNNREIFINFINSLFEPYRQELQQHTDNISCDTLGQTGTNFALLTHQKIVRDYMNLYTPYRGLLLYHGLGSGKTCTSIAIAEGMKDSKRVIIMTPASLEPNYLNGLKECGDLLYKRDQYWEWISTVDNREAATTISALLNLPQEYIDRQKGAFFVNVKKTSNYKSISPEGKQKLEDQLNEMIRQKYTFIHYNGLRARRLTEMTANFTKNIFDNSVVIVDEAHNLISKIVNKLKKEKPVPDEEKRKRKDAKKAGEEKGDEEKAGEEKGDEESIFGEHMPMNIATKLYYMLLRAKNVRIVLLTGTPIINYPNEFAILFNILRGYIKTWKIPLVIKTSKKIDKQALNQMLLGEKSHDYLDYSATSKILTVTRNPFGFKNTIKQDESYRGVSTKQGESTLNVDFIADDEFERKLISILRKNDIEIVPQGIQVINKKALPDDLTLFMARYINDTDNTLKNVDALKRRIVGLSSYFKSAQENLLPKYDKKLGIDYNIVSIPMSDFQFKIYESARRDERDAAKKKKPVSGTGELFDEKSSSYRIFSRLFCNFVMPDRPMPESKKKSKDDAEEEKEGDSKGSSIARIIKEGKNIESKQDVGDDREGEIEGDEILDLIGGISYKERLDAAIKNIEDNSNDFLTPEALQTYSPKFLHILENIKDPEHIGLHLLYSQFRTAEGIGLFCLTLEKNGFARFRIKQNSHGIWQINIPPEDEGKQFYALYTGTETSIEKEMLRRIYNGEWNDIPESIRNELNSKYRNNNMGEVIKVFMITSSGSEGIDLKNTRFVHIMDPYWHPVRMEQVIGRAKRICSHKNLPKALQTVEVFVYLMEFSEAQLKSDEAKELKRGDLSKAIPRVPITSDQYLYELSEIKANLTSQLTNAIKESAFDCYIYSNGKCVNFGDPTNDKFAYVPDYTEQQNDTTVKANKIAVEWAGKSITINGVNYVARRISDTVIDLYDKDIYMAALKDSSIIPLKVGSYETNDKGKKVVKLMVT